MVFCQSVSAEQEEAVANSRQPVTMQCAWAITSCIYYGPRLVF